MMPGNLVKTRWFDRLTLTAIGLAVMHLIASSIATMGLAGGHAAHRHLAERPTVAEVASLTAFTGSTVQRFTVIVFYACLAAFVAVYLATRWMAGRLAMPVRDHPALVGDRLAGDDRIVAAVGLHGAQATGRRGDTDHLT